MPPPHPLEVSQEEENGINAKDDIDASPDGMEETMEQQLARGTFRWPSMKNMGQKLSRIMGASLAPGSPTRRPDLDRKKSRDIRKCQKDNCEIWDHLIYN